MSKKQSNLTNPKYGYDMVVGITQDAINNTMSGYIGSLDGEGYAKVYVWDESEGKVVETDYQQMMNACGFDPFEIANGTSIDDEKVVKLNDLNFEYGFKVTKGLPLDYYIQQAGDIKKALRELYKDLPPVALKADGSSVKYNMFFKNFQYARYPGRRESEFIVFSQNDKNAEGKLEKPLAFPFTVDLNLTEGGEFDKLPAEVKRMVKQLNPSAAFSIQQLYMDLNTAELMSYPEIEGLDNKSDMYSDFRTFIIGCIEDVKNGNATTSEGHFMFGSAVKASGTTGDSSITPTDLTFVNSGYRDKDGHTQDFYGANTLNWLTMTEDHKMPTAVPFDWNWIEEPDKDEPYEADGVMSISRKTFVDQLNKVLSKSLNSVCAVPDIDVYNSGTFNTGVGWSWNIGFDDSARNFTYVNDSSDAKKILTFSYHKFVSDKTDDGAFQESLELAVDYNVKVDVYLENNAIKVVTNPVAHLMVNYSIWPKESGNIVNLTATDYYDLTVDNHGIINTAHRQETTEDHSDSFDVNILVDALSGMGDKIKDAKKKVNDRATVYMNSYKDKMTDLVSSPSFFILPAGKTFTFKDVGFSDYQDLVSFITYVDPT